MKNHQNIFAIVAIISILFFTSCSDKNNLTNSNLIEIQNACQVNIASLSKYDNLNISNGIEIDIPNSISEISSFSIKYMDRESNKDFYNSFIETMQFLFPSHKINNQFLYYYGNNSYYEVDDNGNVVNDLHKVNDYYNKIINDEEDVLYFLYDETWESNKCISNPICAEFTSPICNDLSKFCKGNILNYTEDTIGLESIQIKTLFPIISKENKNSEEYIKLSDKEISINEAVSVYEDYINSIPCKGNENFKMMVCNVDVLKLDSNTNGLFFNTTVSYNGIPFDYTESGVFRRGMDDYNFIIGEGFMLESSDIDYAYGIYRNLCVIDEIKQTKILSCENAVESLSNNLTNSVVFDLNKIELIYLEKNNTNSNHDIADEYSITPYWKFTLFNNSDKLTYTCYVNCLNDEFLYYLTNN